MGRNAVSGCAPRPRVPVPFGGPVTGVEKLVKPATRPLRETPRRRRGRGRGWAARGREKKRLRKAKKQRALLPAYRAMCRRWAGRGAGQPLGSGGKALGEQMGARDGVSLTCRGQSSAPSSFCNTLRRRVVCSLCCCNALRRRVACESLLQPGFEQPGGSLLAQLQPCLQHFQRARFAPGADASFSASFATLRAKSANAAPLLLRCRLKLQASLGSL